MGILGIVLIGLVILFWKEFKLVSFDEDYAESLGFSTNRINTLLFTMIVTAIIIGLQTVGVILMSAMLTAPGVAARQWTDKLSVMVLLSAFFGAISGVIGTVLSSIIPKLPTGPMIVVVISIIVIISLAFAPNRGLVWRYIRNKKNQKEINEDQVLMNLYHLAMNHNDVDHSHDVLTIKPKAKSAEANKQVLTKLDSLMNRNLAKKDYFNKWSITDEGINYIQNYFKKEED
jgi:manganese/zinc/iron transport system permease protein